MGNYEFDTVPSRINTYSTKWSFIKEHTGNEEVLPLWIADMDFETVPEIKQELMKRMEHGIYGYTSRSEEYYAVLINWFKKRHGWEIDREWITHSPGVVNAVYNAIYAYSEAGDGVIIQPPVYPPFAKAIKAAGRKVLCNPLILREGRYSFDLKGLKHILETNWTTLLILCNPHNPVGRVFSDDELKELGDLCFQYGIKVISDEIHSDFVYQNYKFRPFASISAKFAQNTIVCTAPSKTFNLAGLATSNIIIPNPDLKNKYDEYCAKVNIKSYNIFGGVACETAYKYGEPWLEALLVYLEDNKNYAAEYIKEHIPEINVILPEGTYFLWVDLRNLGLGIKELEHFLLHTAKLWLNQGYHFGTGGEGFVRINMACPRSTLEEALKRLHLSLHKL